VEKMDFQKKVEDMEKRWVEVMPDNADWNPTEEDESIEGEVISVIENEGKYRVELKTKENITFRTRDHYMLSERVKKLVAGDKVRITYRGEIPSKQPGKSPLKKYKVEKFE
jgi:hypothetical protein